MPTDGTLDAIVFDASEPWLAARTLRSLARRGVRGVVATPGTLADRVAASSGPVWLVRAGAWALEAPSPLLTGPGAAAARSGRSVVALGATAESAAWRDVLVHTGGDLARARAWPRVDSAVALDPRSFATLVAETGTVEHAAVAAAAARARVVRVPSLDVGYQRSLRIVLAVTTLHRGGAERIVLDLGRALEEAGHDVLVAVVDRASRATFDAPSSLVELHRSAKGRAARIDLLGSLAAERGADVVHAHLLDGDEVARLADGVVPVVVTVHNARPGWPARFEGAMRKANAPLLVGCSRGVTHELYAAGLGARARTVWNGITSAAVAPPREGALAARIALGVPGPEPVLLAIANHRPQKRLDRLPAILAAVRARGVAARLLLVGEPVRSDPEALSVARQVQGEAERLGVGAHVVLAGSRADIATAYAAADVVVSASAFEGLSLVHLEALAAGLPLVTTRVPGVDELARKHARVRIVGVDAAPEAFAIEISASLGGEKEPGLAPDFSTRRMADRYAELFARVSVARPAPAAGLTPASGQADVVLVTNNFSTGGAQSSARRLLVALAAAGVSVSAVVIEEQAAYPTSGRSALSAAGVPVVVAPRAGSVDPLVTARAVVASVDAARARAVLFWNVIPEHKVLIADLLLDVPVWDVSPGEMYFASFERYFGKPRVGSPYLETRDYGRLLAGAIVKYASERERAIEALGVRVEVVPNGLAVPPRPSRRAAGSEIVVGTLARIAPDKKLEQLIDAVAHARRAGTWGDSMVLRIAGAPERGSEAYAEELRARSRSEGLPIAWVGERDATAFLGEVDLFAMVSEPSGCPNASLEAMAAGLAVVATDVGGAKEQIVDRDTGILVPRGDSSALGDAIAGLACDRVRRERMGDAAHARARERFGIDRMAAAYAKILGIRLD